MTPRVAVFIDYQNVHFSARSGFQPADAPRHHGHVDHGRVAERIVAGRRFGGEFAAVRVYRGCPSPIANRYVISSMAQRGPVAAMYLASQVRRTASICSASAT